jgi:putative salt-induced outer membrane protein
MKTLLAALAFIVSLVPTLARAQEPGEMEVPQGVLEDSEAASKGTTDLDGLDEFSAALDPNDVDGKDATNLDLSAGGLVSTGNARAISGTSTGHFRVRRKIHQFLAEYAGNYGRAAVDANSDPKTTVGNIQGRLRYDVFALDYLSVFGMATARHDPFQGLDLRLNVGPGVAFYVLDEAKHRLWTEVGYDFQYEYRTLDATYDKDDDGNILFGTDGRPIVIAPRTRRTHAARLFGGYSNQLNERVSFRTGVEYLQSVLHAERWRVNWDNALNANLIKTLSLAVTFAVRVDNAPAPNIEKIDTVTALSLVYQVF